MAADEKEKPKGPAGIDLSNLDAEDFGSETPNVREDDVADIVEPVSRDDDDETPHCSIDNPAIWSGGSGTYDDEWYDDDDFDDDEDDGAIII